MAAIANVAMPDVNSLGLTGKGEAASTLHVGNRSEQTSKTTVNDSDQVHCWTHMTKEALCPEHGYLTTANSQAHR